MSTLQYWLHVIFDTWKFGRSGACLCWICKVVKWKT